MCAEQTCSVSYIAIAQEVEYGYSRFINGIISEQTP